MTFLGNSEVGIVMRPYLLMCVLAFSASAGAQSNVRGIVQGGVHGVLQEATVALHVDTTRPALRVARTGSDGRFELDGVPRGTYWLRTRRIGFGPTVQKLTVSGIIDTSLVIALESDPYRRMLERKREAAFDSALALARSRPRRWTCATGESLRREYAKRWAYLAEAAAERDRKGQRNDWGIPANAETFLAQFRPISDPSECARIARAIDAEQGLIEDHLIVYRIGNVLLFPEFDWVADTTGKIIAVFVTQQ